MFVCALSLIGGLDGEDVGESRGRLQVEEDKQDHSFLDVGGERETCTGKAGLEQLETSGSAGGVWNPVLSGELF